MWQNEPAIPFHFDKFHQHLVWQLPHLNECPKKNNDFDQNPCHFLAIRPFDKVQFFCNNLSGLYRTTQVNIENLVCSLFQGYVAFPQNHLAKGDYESHPFNREYIIKLFHHQ